VDAHAARVGDLQGVVRHEQHARVVLGAVVDEPVVALPLAHVPVEAVCHLEHDPALAAPTSQQREAVRDDVAHEDHVEDVADVPELLVALLGLLHARVVAPADLVRREVRPVQAQGLGNEGKVLHRAKVPRVVEHEEAGERRPVLPGRRVRARCRAIVDPLLHVEQQHLLRRRQLIDGPLGLLRELVASELEASGERAGCQNKQPQQRREGGDAHCDYRT
jgi:hypothetical protein